jgi:hypothetical protein
LAWINRLDYSALVDGVSVETEAGTDYTALAYICYSGTKSDDPNLIRAVENGCNWLVGRPIRRTTGELQSFALDPVALLGILLGASRLSDPMRGKVVDHVKEALNSSSSGFAQDALKMAFADACVAVIRGSVFFQKSSSPAILCALLGRLALDIPPSAIEPAFRECQTATARQLESFEAGMFLFAMEGLLNQTAEFDLIRPTVEQVFSVLSGVDAGLIRWPYGKNKNQYWEIENEYDVQSMLYFLLRPYLPELKEEEPLPSIGRKRPRVDLVVPSLRLSIEVKFLRKSESFNEMLGEVAEDKSLYLGPNSAYSRMLVFLWDDSSRTEDHASFKRGVIELGLDGAVVVSRPSFMVRRSIA